MSVIAGYEIFDICTLFAVNAFKLRAVNGSVAVRRIVAIEVICAVVSDVELGFQIRCCIGISIDGRFKYDESIQESFPIGDVDVKSHIRIVNDIRKFFSYFIYVSDFFCNLFDIKHIACFLDPFFSSLIALDDLGDIS